MTHHDSSGPCPHDLAWAGGAPPDPVPEDVLEPVLLEEVEPWEELERHTGRYGDEAPPRAWFLGEAPAPEAEPVDAEGRARMAVEVRASPMLRWLREILTFVGEGRKVTHAGTFYVTEVKQFLRETRPAAARSRDRWGTEQTGPSLDERLRLLRMLGWLETVERTVRPTAACPAPAELHAADGEALADVVRTLLAAIVERSRRHGGGVPRFAPAVAPDPRALLDALLVTTRHEGLLLPWSPQDGHIDHCWQACDYVVGLLGHPHIRRVPLDPVSGHPDPRELAGLAAIDATLGDLVRWGVLEAEKVRDDSGEPLRSLTTRYRGPLVLRGAVAEVRQGLW